MALEAWMNDPTLGKEPCATDRDSWRCPNMKYVEGDLSMDCERYRCSVCGRDVKLDYEEMR